MTPMDRTETRKQLWNSVDAKFHRRTLGVCMAMLCFCGVSCGILFQLARDTAVFLAIEGCAVTLPLLTWRLWRLLRIFRKPEHYLFFRTTLSGAHCPKGNHRMLYFPVTIHDSERGTIQRRTAAIFYLRKRLGPMLGDYLDKTVTVAWNRETDMVVVIGR